MDDESDVCFVLEKVLGENGFVVDSYEDPLLALEKFKAYLYNLVILDIKMPELNGFALYREIKRLDKKVKVCFLTAGEMYYGVYSQHQLSASLSAIAGEYMVDKGYYVWFQVNAANRVLLVSGLQ